MVEAGKVYALPLEVCDSCWCQYSHICKWSKNSAVASMLARRPGSQRDLCLGIMRTSSLRGCKASILIVLQRLQSSIKPFFRQRWMQVHAIASCTAAEEDGYCCWVKVANYTSSLTSPFTVCSCHVYRIRLQAVFSGGFVQVCNIISLFPDQSIFSFENWAFHTIINCLVKS